MNIKKCCEDFATSYFLFCLLGAPILNNLAIHLSPKMNKGELEIILDKEKSKFDIKKKDIQIFFDNNLRSSNARKIDNDVYIISLSRNQRNKMILRHELYHIAKGHCDRYSNYLDLNVFKVGMRFLDYTFVMEPTASIYSLTGLK